MRFRFVKYFGILSTACSVCSCSNSPDDSSLKECDEKVLTPEEILKYAESQFCRWRELEESTKQQILDFLSRNAEFFSDEETIFNFFNLAGTENTDFFKKLITGNIDVSKCTFFKRGEFFGPDFNSWVCTFLDCESSLTYAPGPLHFVRLAEVFEEIEELLPTVLQGMDEEPRQFLEAWVSFLKEKKDSLER